MEQKQLVRKIRALKNRENRENRMGDDLAWVVASLRQLYELCNRYEQFSYPESTDHRGYSYVKRVVKVNRFIEDHDLQKVDHAFCSGLFVAVEGAFIDRFMMAKLFNDKLKESAPIFYDELTELNLPFDLQYNTIRRLTNGMGFVIRNTKFNSKYIPYRGNWDFLEL